MNADVLTALPAAKSDDCGQAALSIRTAADFVPEQWLRRENLDDQLLPRLVNFRDSCGERRRSPARGGMYRSNAEVWFLS